MTKLRTATNRLPTQLLLLELEIKQSFCNLELIGVCRVENFIRFFKTINPSTKN
jgi:hypothetical protein